MSYLKDDERNKLALRWYEANSKFMEKHKENVFFTFPSAETKKNIAIQPKIIAAQIAKQNGGEIPVLFAQPVGID